MWERAKSLFRYLKTQVGSWQGVVGRIFYQLMCSHSLILIILVVLNSNSLAQSKKKKSEIKEGSYVSSVWVGENSDGTYKNPIIYADYSDPDVCRVGNDFYMTSSSFNCVPALPILHSKDLVNWTIINHAVKRFPDEYYNTVQHGNGVWAPSIRFHDGWFYIYWGDPDRGIYMVKTQDPAGEWEAPVLVKKAHGNIDSCPLWDDDDKVYMVHAFANSRAGVSDVLQVQELSSDGTAVTRNRKIVFNGYQKHPTLEGPKFYKRNGYYYIFAPGGGVAEGWQVVLRSENPMGPYEDRIVLAQGDTDINGPHQGGYVELDNGEGWFIHFQEVQPYGRIVHLNPVRWEDDWPVMGVDKDDDGTGEPVLTHKKPDVGETYPIVTPQESDEFDSEKLGLQWQWQANYYNSWYSLADNPGYLRLNSVFTPDTKNSLWMVPNQLLQKLPAPSFTATTKLDASHLLEGERTGLTLMGMDYAVLSISRSGNDFKLKYGVCDNAFGGMPEVTKQSVNLEDAEIWLKVKMEKGGMCQFSYSENGEGFKNIGEPFQAVEGRWIGAKVGIFAQKDSETGSFGYAEYDWFRID